MDLLIIIATVTAAERFQAASEKNRESIQRHLQEDDNNGDQSSEDEEDIGDNVLEKIFQTYSTTTGWLSIHLVVVLQ